MVESAVLSRPLLELLLSEHEGNKEAIIALLVKYGLLVPVDGGEDREGSVVAAQQLYLVPSLLYASPIISARPKVAYHTRCVLVFSATDSFGPRKSSYSQADILRDGLLPSGLFSRLLGRAVAWSQQTSHATLDAMALSADRASLVFGNQSLRLVECRAERFVSLEIEGRNPTAVQIRVLELIEKTLAECMPILACFVLLPFQDGSSISYVPLDLVRSRLKDHDKLRLAGGLVLEEAELAAHFGLWTIAAVVFLYDLFISYRWGTFDSDFTAKLFDYLSFSSVGASSRAAVVFLDRERLRDGENFKEAFARALAKSSVVVPIISREALGRMLQGLHRPDAEDNLLIEWILSIECLASPLSRVQKILPVVFDRPSTLPPFAVGSFFAAAGLWDLLSEAVPSASLARAAALLKANGIDMRTETTRLTVKEIVGQLLEFQCIQLHEFKPAGYIYWSSARITEAVNSCSNLGDIDATSNAPVAGDGDADASSSVESLPAVPPAPSSPAAVDLSV